ncbi:OmpH family outer membrane protein [Caulobacter segnis]|uniref:OmpH family outer membrane protein n=1 Tax=Caulobacter segnis TaxID=88688 RepID=UPI002410165D|nr:OmpH family outer membrane protein [Caulobacter segnis]MDG2522029.1 OmpH family outer membrane protein [Caulobacter segnis]
MTLRNIVATASGVVAGLAIASTALAQTQAPAAVPAAPAMTHGAAIPGMCLFSSAAVVANSAVGKAVNTRLQQIATQVNSELTTERTALETEAKTLETQRATLDQNTLEQRAAALQVKANAFERKAQLRQREVAATEQKALNRVATEMNPIVRQVYQAQKCAVLVDQNAVLVGNPAMSINDQVVQGLNGKIQTFAFDRERLDQPAPAAQTTPPARK